MKLKAEPPAQQSISDALQPESRVYILMIVQSKAVRAAARPTSRGIALLN